MEELEQIRKEREEKIKTINILKAINAELTSEESAPLITQISDFLEIANSDPDVIHLNNEISRKEEALKLLEEEVSRYDKKYQHTLDLQNIYMEKIQSEFAEAMNV